VNIANLEFISDTQILAKCKVLEVKVNVTY